MSTPLLLGRDFAETDTMAAPRVVIIGEATARHFFGFTNAIGKTIGMGNENGSGQTLYYVIGVVKDSKYRSINETERLTGFVAASQDEDPRAATTFEIRVNGSPVALTKTVRDAIVSVSRDVTLQFRDMETQVNDSVLQPRLVALLSTVFGSLALLLATVGLYGITAYEVSRRKSEIGIRIALGAPRRSVIWLALRDTGTLLGAGMAAGVAASLAAGRLVKSLLFDVRPNDPRQVAIALLILAAAAILAAYLPARSAARLDPIETLRDE